MIHKIKQLHDWFCANKLSLNVIFLPCKHQKVIQTTVLKYTITLLTRLARITKYEFLGLHLNKHLTWKEYINKISSKISRVMFVIIKVSYHTTQIIKSLYYIIIHSHIKYGVQERGNGNTVSKLITLQIRFTRIINNKRFRKHIDPIFKSQNILKIVDVYQLHVSLFMYDFHHNLLPKSFTNYIPKKNLDESSRITTQHNLLAKEKPRTHFSSKLTKYNFTKISNNIGNKTQNIKHGSKFKHMLSKQYLDEYHQPVHCLKLRCTEYN